MGILFPDMVSYDGDCIKLFVQLTLYKFMETKLETFSKRKL